MSLQSSNQDSSLADEKAKKEDRPPLNPFGDDPDEEEPSDDLSKQKKVHYITVSGKVLRTPSTGSI